MPAELSRTFLQHCVSVAAKLSPQTECVTLISIVEKTSQHFDRSPEYSGFNSKRCREHNHCMTLKTNVTYLPLIGISSSYPDTITASIEAYKLHKTERVSMMFHLTDTTFIARG